MLQQTFFTIISLIILAIVLAQVRNQRMKEKYAGLWLLVSAIVIVLAIFPQLLFTTADLLHITNPANLLFFLSILTLIGVTLQLSLELSSAAEDTRRIAEEVAILRSLVEQKPNCEKDFNSNFTSTQEK